MYSGSGFRLGVNSGSAATGIGSQAMSLDRQPGHIPRPLEFVRGVPLIVVNDYRTRPGLRGKLGEGRAPCRRFLLLLLFALIMMSGCISSLRPTSIVIARVNGSPITRDDLVEELRQFHRYQMRSGQAGELNIPSFLNDMIDRRLFIQEARRMGLDQATDFQKTMADESEQICLQTLREEKIVQPSGPLTQGDVDAYYRELGQSPPRLLVQGTGEGEESLRLSLLESQEIKMRKEERFSQAYIQGLKQKSRIEIFEQKLTEVSSRMEISSRTEGGSMADLTKLYHDPEPVARVNGEKISGHDLYEEIKTKVEAKERPSPCPLPPGERRKGDGLYKEDSAQIVTFAHDGLNRLIEYWLLRQEAYRQGYLKRADVRKRLQRREDDLLYHTFLQNVLAPTVQVKSEEIERYYQDHLSSFQAETMVYLEQIVVEDPNSAQHIYRELLQGADFAFLARQKAVKSEGDQPEIGNWVSLQKMQPKLRSLLSVQGDEKRSSIVDNGASGLKEGQIIPPVQIRPGLPGKLGSGYSIFRVREKKGGEQIPLEKVKIRVEKEIASQKFHSTAHDWLQRLRTASRIVIDENSVQKMSSIHQP